MKLRCLISLLSGISSLVASADSRLTVPLTFGGVRAFAFSPDGTTVAGGMSKVTITSNNVVTGVDAGGIVLWDPATGEIRSQLGPVGDTVDGLAWTADGQRLLGLNSELGRVYVYDPSLSAPLRTLNSPDGALFVPVVGWRPAFAVSPDGRRVAVSGLRMETANGVSKQNAGSLSVWDLNSGELLWSKPDADAVEVTFANWGETLLAYCYRLESVPDGSGGTISLITDQKLKSWNVTDGTPHFEVPMPRTTVRRLLPSPDGTEVLALAAQQSGWYDALTGARNRPQPIPFTGTIQLAQADPSGDRLLIAGSNPSAVHLFQFSTGSALPVFQFESFSERPFFSAASPDLTRLAVSSNQLKLIDLPIPRIISRSESAEGVEFQVEAPAGTFSELRFRTDLDSPWTAVQSVLPTTNRFLLRDNDPTHRAACAGFWQVYFQ